MTYIRRRSLTISLAPAATACYTPAAMADMTTLELILHIQTEPLLAADAGEAIHTLAGILAQKAGLASSLPLVESAMQREATEPTFLGRGMALPHARVAGLAAAGVCIAHAPAGVPWNGERAQLVIFIAVPDEQPELYLQLMSRLVRWRLRLEDAALAQPLLPAAAWEVELAALLR